ncbi:ubiquitin carboxyl-terminal hydrolase 19-like [Triticum dicoccoides]|uniref:ubiquitin carboxyl-terminal hydrolase 19-like n=1 Tax=Triticum dicoccoides TaxID=85692 RepID=UPI00188FA439|nr:ubiquitin carboxyl-terminal hydrolase 19-like [Triticum dicoccoides]
MAERQGQAAAGQKLKVCAVCGRPSTKKCALCLVTKYCSKACSRRHWKSEHKVNCKGMKLPDPVDKLTLGGNGSTRKSSDSALMTAMKEPGKVNNVLFPYDEFVKLYNWKGRDTLPCGLLNSGNSCFGNVILQCLSGTNCLVAYLLEKDHKNECYVREADWCFLCELQAHMERATGGTKPFAPLNILSHLQNIGGDLTSGKQEDAHEFLRFAIDKMQSDCLGGNDGEKAVDLSIQETTIIQHIFGGRLRSQVQCTECSFISDRYERMMDLPVEIEGDVHSLEECLLKFTAKEWLDGDNKYKCDRCDKHVKACKRLTIYEAPNILTITLKRFQSGRFGKLNKLVTFPAKLDLTSYMSAADGSDQYDLYAVVVHLDERNASFFGHYICFIKHLEGNWYKVDDSKVIPVDKEEVHDQGAYMLLYRRTSSRPRPLLPVKNQQLEGLQVDEILCYHP